MYIARILYPVEVLGPGKRIGIWFCGCPRRCEGCSNPELWEFQERYQVPEYRKYFVSSMQKIKNLPVDLVLGNHTGQNHTMEKRAAMGQNPDGTNPFVVPGEWKQMIEGAIEQYETMLREETDGTDQEQTEL